MGNGSGREVTGDGAGTAGERCPLAVLGRRGLAPARPGRRAPVTVLLVAAIWIVGAITGSLLHGPSDELHEMVRSGCRR